jgi:hypothetical protein
LNGESSYTFEPCTYRLDTPVTLPGGLSNFSLLGAGSDRTIFTTPVVRLGSNAIQVGVTALLHNHWGLTNRRNWAIAPVQEGQSRVTLNPGQEPFPGVGSFVIYDNEYMCPHNDPNTGTCIKHHAQLVRVISYNAATREAVLDVPVGRDFVYGSHSNPYARLAWIDNPNDFRVSSNITIGGFGFDGTVQGQTGSSSGALLVGMVDGLLVEDVRATQFSGWAIHTNMSRNIVMRRMNTDGATAGGPGAGYGLTFSLSQNVYVTDSFGARSRHPYIVHAGNMDLLFENSFMGGFDTHGFDSRRIVVRDCIGYGHVSLGNAAWLEGDEVTLERCNLQSGSLGWMAGHRMEMRDAIIKNIDLYASDLKDLVFEGIRFVAEGPTSLRFVNSGADVDVKFINCSFESRDQGWGRALSIRSYGNSEGGIGGKLEFLNSSFSMDRNTPPIEITNGPATLDVIVTNGTFRRGVNEFLSTPGIVYYNNARGRLILSNNRLFSTASTLTQNSSQNPYEVIESGTQFVRP